MKIALPSNQNNVDEHFGHCEYFTIFTVNENNEILSEEKIDSGTGCGCKSNIAQTLSEMGVKIMLAGNMGQVSVAVLFIFGKSGWIIAPVVLTIGLVTSTFLGILAQRFVEKSKWIRSLQDEKAVSMGDS